MNKFGIEKVETKNLPESLIDFLNYLDTIKGKSKNTIDGYEIDLSMFFKFLKVYKGLIFDEDIEFNDINIKDIQPSQFFVDLDKVKAIETFIEGEEDIIIPLIKMEDRFISLDGHTRLYYAVSKGYSSVKGYLTEGGSYIYGFVDEARKRNIFSPYELKLISHEEYEIKWNKFCDDFFRERNET